MSEAVQIALIASITPTVAAICALIIGIINGRKANVAATKADSLLEKTTEIHTLTNSNLARVQAALDVANEKIKGLEQVLTSIADRQKAHDTNLG